MKLSWKHLEPVSALIVLSSRLRLSEVKVPNTIKLVHSYIYICNLQTDLPTTDETIIIIIIISYLFIY